MGESITIIKILTVITKKFKPSDMSQKNTKNYYRSTKRNYINKFNTGL